MPCMGKEADHDKSWRSFDETMCTELQVLVVTGKDNKTRPGHHTALLCVITGMWPYIDSIALQTGEAYLAVHMCIQLLQYPTPGQYGPWTP